MPTFKNIILLGRPASGKSEFIDFFKKLPEKMRAQEYHIGPFVELDDFLWLWEKFVEDDAWEAAGHPRRFSKREGHGYVMTGDARLLDFCLARFNAEFAKQPKDKTVFVEFARGAADGGYAHALSRLSDDILKEAVIVFIYASYEEACRRNEARYQEKLKHSVLAHKVPPEDMVRFGREIDWLAITGEKAGGTLTVRGHAVPFVTMNNEPELKPDNPDLALRYKTALDELVILSETKNPR